MELDSRILEGKKPLTCFDIDEAEKYVGKKCYISNEYDFFRNLDFTQQKILNGVEDCEEPFHYDQLKQAKFCLPCEWVKKEPKYRPFSLAEWIEQHEIGEVIHYRSKSEGIALHHMYVGYAYGIGKDINEIGVGTLTLGVASYSFDYLFEDYELFYNGRWLPFGVIDEDKEQGE